MGVGMGQVAASVGLGMGQVAPSLGLGMGQVTASLLALSYFLCIQAKSPSG